MNFWFALLLGAASLRAAVIHGSVVTSDGEPLALAAVTLKPISGSGTSSGTVKTDQFGIFTFRDVEPGAYLLSASRPNFIQAYYGQKRWNSAGTPLMITGDAAPNVSITMHRFGAISGRIVDENGVGIPNQEVLAYCDTEPPEIIAKSKADDYGRYRIYGLSAGIYVIRSGAQRIDTANFVPTFAPGSLELSQARRVDVPIDVEISGADLRPEQGKLIDIAVGTDPPPYCGPVEITLAGELGRQTRPGPNARFEPVTPGRYEVYARAPCVPDLANMQMAGGYANTVISEDQTIDLHMNETPATSISYSSGFTRYSGTGKLQLEARRVDLAGHGETQALGDAPASAMLAAGRWELLLQPDSSQSVTGFSAFPQSPHAMRITGVPPDGWNEVFIASTGRFSGLSVRYSLSGGQVSLRGVVSSGPSQPVVGAPVYLEPYDTNRQKRLADPRATTTDAQGNYQFQGLPSGSYRVLSTFEYASPDAQSMTSSRAIIVRITAGRSVTQDLSLFILQ